MSTRWTDCGRGADYDRFLRQENASHESARIRREEEAEWLESNIRHANRDATHDGRARWTMVSLLQRLVQMLRSLRRVRPLRRSPPS
jgi:hypothetical protein